MVKSVRTICAKTDTIEWNSDKNLFAFTDVILNLKTVDVYPPRPEQYINETCGFPWLDTFHGYSEEEMKEAQQFVRQFVYSLTENEEMTAYLFRMMASWLHGTNIVEKAYFFLGEGGNGKGTLTTLLHRAFGNYYRDLKLEYYTTLPKSSDAPDSNLHNISNARIVNTSEVASGHEKGEVFLDAPYKRLVGDPVSARKAHGKDTVRFKAGNIIIQCNAMPKFKGTNEVRFLFSPPPPFFSATHCRSLPFSFDRTCWR